MPVNARNRCSLKLQPYIKLLRIDHWIKNIFMFPGVAIAISFNSIPYGRVLTAGTLWSVALSLVALCIASSANYTINEWLDRSFDKVHPYKNHRVASRYKFSGRAVYFQYSILVLVVLLTLPLQAKSTGLFLAALLIMGVLYNVRPSRLKDRIYMDVISESINNPIRLAIGWHSIMPDKPVPASAFLSFWGIGIFLMSLKRYSEMVVINNPELLGQYRKSFLKWTPEKLIVFTFFGGMVATSFIGVLLVRYRIEYILVLPSFIWIFVEYLRISLKLDPASFAPEKLMAKTKLQLLALLVLAAFLLFTFIDIPLLDKIIG
jgi:4-hydroxybenzoate polyprenyltransferase